MAESLNGDASGSNNEPLTPPRRCISGSSNMVVLGKLLRILNGGGECVKTAEQLKKMEIAADEEVETWRRWSSSSATQWSLARLWRLKTLFLSP
jgi:hypothetical protein